MQISDTSAPGALLNRSTILIIGAWGLVTVLSAAQGYLAQVALGSPEPWMRSLAYAATVYLSWAVLTPVVLAAARRAKFNARNILPFLAAHVPVGVLLALAHSSFQMLVFWNLYPDKYGILSSVNIFSQKLISNLHVDILIYALIVYVYNAVQAYGDSQKRALDAARLETKIAEVEAAALRARLQPHFLFNSLNAISALIQRDPTRAERLVARLGDLLRVTVEEQRAQIASFAEELEFTLAYLEIEEARIGERLRIVQDIDERAFSARLPSLILQPLAENAIRHGAAPTTRPVRLLLRAEVRDDMLHVIVKDDGVGADEVNERLGIGGCRRRLSQLYGSKASVEIFAAKGVGFEIRLRVPQ
jgi:two-component sensor histidine kinase